MAIVLRASPNHWVVHLALQSESDSEVAVDLRMSNASAKSLAHLESSCIAAICRMKQRVGSFDQQEIMAIIDDEVDSTRAGRP